MPNLTSVLRDEIGRLSRKAIRKETKTTKRMSAQHRRTLAELKRQVDDLLRRLTFLESQEKRRVSKAAPIRDGAEKVRFSPKWLKSHRQRLGLSAADYARLVGVSVLTVYNWEQGKSKPREQHMPRLAAVAALTSSGPGHGRLQNGAAHGGVHTTVVPETTYAKTTQRRKTQVKKTQVRARGRKPSRRRPPEEDYIFKPAGLLQFQNGVDISRRSAMNSGFLASVQVFPIDRQR